jgi:hypothetical protein
VAPRTNAIDAVPDRHRRVPDRLHLVARLHACGAMARLID